MPPKVKKEQRLHWTQLMDEFSLKPIYKSMWKAIGWGGTFTTYAHYKILQTMKKGLPHIAQDKDKIQNHMIKYQEILVDLP